MAEIFHPSAFLGWSAEHFEGDSRNLAGMFPHNSVFHQTLSNWPNPICCPLLITAAASASVYHHNKRRDSGAVAKKWTWPLVSLKHKQTQGCEEYHTRNLTLLPFSVLVGILPK